MILTLACRLSKFSNSCKELAFSWNCCAFLVCSWSALNAEWIFSSFSSLSPASIIWIFLSSAKHWFSSSSNSFLNTPKLMWSPGTQTWNREPFSLVSCMSLFKAMKWTLIGAENGLSYLLFRNECLYFQLKKIFYYLATCFEFNELVRIYSDSSAHWAKGSTHFKKKMTNN